jgi:hypothetical protein
MTKGSEPSISLARYDGGFGVKLSSLLSDLCRMTVQAGSNPQLSLTGRSMFPALTRTDLAGSVRLVGNSTVGNSAVTLKATAKFAITHWHFR